MLRNAGAGGGGGAGRGRGRANGTGRGSAAPATIMQERGKVVLEEVVRVESMAEAAAAQKGVREQERAGRRERLPCPCRQKHEKCYCGNVPADKGCCVGSISTKHKVEGCSD